MRKLTVTGIIILFFISSSFAQQGSVIKGVIIDTSAKENLSNTVISLLRGGDSVLYRFTRSNATGAFEINGIDTGHYVLLVTRNRYADYVDKLFFNGAAEKNLGKIIMSLKANLLQDVTVRQKIAAIRLKGDTLEFAADSFKVREGGSVEELLKKLPGLQVDKDGNITAQGEKVEKVLVDGEEFFGDDPTLATQNLQADAVEKVQVFDKKSDQATFTGIDDGEKTKTINLKLKDDKKKGYFGKLEAGGGLDDRWNNSLMLNNFKGKRKVSFYGIMSSTGKTGLNWNERGSYGGESGTPEYNDDFGGFIFFGGGDEFENPNFYGQGIPKSWSTGINYSNKFNEDKQSLNGSYRYNKINTLGSGNTFSQSILPDTSFFNRENGSTFNSRQRHSLNETYDWQIDSSTSVKMYVKGYTGRQNTNSSYTSQALNEFNIPVNNSTRNTSSDGTNTNFDATVLLREKFKKAGRTLSLNLEQVYSKNNSTGYLFSLNSFYDKAGVVGVVDTTDQQKVNNTLISTFNAKLTYTEPIIKNVFAELSYALHSNNSDAEQLSYDKNDKGKYEVLNDTFSSHYKFDVLSNIVGAAFKYNGKKITAGIGTNIAKANFDQTDLLKDTVFKRTYTNFFPRVNFTYKFNQSTRINVSYRGQTNQPSISQIQPVADNNNPLIITIGNPLLKQEFRHSMYFNFNNYKVLSQRGVYMYGNISTTGNAIVTNNTTDSSGRTIYQYVNANGNYNTYAGLGYNKKLKKLDMNFNLDLNYNNSLYSNFVNTVKNKTKNISYNMSLYLSKEKEKKYNISFNPSIGYNTSVSSVNTALETKYLTLSQGLDATFYLPWKIEVNNEVRYDWRQKTSLFDNNNNVFLWNAYIGRKVLKNDKGLIKFQGYDILNQNKGFDRIINTNVVQERNYQTLTRYFLLSFVWNFSKSPAGMIPGGGQ